MNILRSIGEVIKNGSNFKQWEKEQNTNDAKREELAKKKPPTVQELKSAKALGDTIIDSVNIMNQHSENVAENVETAASIPMLFIPLATLIGSFVVTGKKLITPAQKELFSQSNDFIKNNSKKLEEIVKKLREDNPKKEYRISRRSVLNEKFADKLKQSAQQKLELTTLQKELNKIQSKTKAKLKLGITAPFVAMAAAFVGGTIYSAILQVNSSKIARFQARNILKDPKYFVEYTDEQEKQAEENLKQKTANKKHKFKDDKLKSGMLRSIGSVLRDGNAYSKWKNSEDAKPERINRELSKQELETAIKDKEVIQRVVKKINNNAENYSANMEVAGAVLIGGTPFLGWFSGKLTSVLLGKTKMITNYVQKQVNKYGDKEAKEAYSEMIKEGEKSPEFKKLKFKFYGKMLNSTPEKEVQEVIKVSKLAEIINLLHRLTPIILSTKTIRNKFLGIAGGLLSGITGALIGLKMQKSAVRVGQYEAKKELEQNPKEFIGYTPEDYNSVKSKPIKKKNGFMDYVTFLPREIKQYFEYQNYKKTKLVHEKRLKEELVKMEVSDKQLRDAKDLQRKIFNTFEQVDDKSQDYSESVEAFTDVAKPLVLTGGIFTMLAPLIIISQQVRKGKLTTKSVAKKVINFLSKKTDIMQKKFFKNYLNAVAKNVPFVVSQSTPDQHILKKALAGINFQRLIDKPYNVTYDEILNPLARNLESLTKKEMNEFLATVKDKPIIQLSGIADGLSDKVNINKSAVIKALKEKASKLEDEKVFDNPGVKKIVKKLKISNELEKFRKKLSNMSDEQAQKELIKASDKLRGIWLFKELDIESIDKAYALEMIPKIQKIIKNVPKEESKNILNSFIAEIQKDPDRLMKAFGSVKIMNIFATDGLKKAAKAAGISWVALNLTLIFLIESMLADMQLKAGRLGVMKALENLKDPAYYANSGQSDDKKQKKNSILDKFSLQHS